MRRREFMLTTAPLPPRPPGFPRADGVRRVDRRPKGHRSDGAPRSIGCRGPPWVRWGPAARRVAGLMQHAVRDAAAAGPQIPNELLMMDADPSVRVGPISGKSY